MKPHITGSPGCWIYVYGYNFETHHYHVVSRQMGSYAIPEKLKIEPTLTIYYFRGWFPVNRDHFLRQIFR